MQEFVEIIFTLILLFFFLKQVSRNKVRGFFCACVCVYQAPVLVFAHKKTCTYATRIIQASLLNCGGSGIVLAIGSVPLLYRKRFHFLTAQQCLINPGLGDVDAGH